MKIVKVLCGVLAAGMLFLPSCDAPEVIASVGIYSYYEAETLIDGDVPRFTLFEDGTYSFHYAMHSSFFGYGTYVLDGDTLVLTQNNENGMEYRFEKKGDSYVFDGKNSSKVTHLADMPDGAVFSPGEPEFGRKVSPFGNIDPEKTTMFYSVFDGEVSRTANLAYGERPVTEEQTEIYEKLRDTPVKKVDSIEVSEPTAPVYGIHFVSIKDGKEVSFGWSNGFLYADDGSVWSADIDFPALIEDYPLDWANEKEGINDLPCAYYMAQSADGWKAAFLRSGNDFVPVEDVTAAAAEVTDGEIAVECTNRGTDNWSVQENYIVQVKLEGMWYDVPLLPGFCEPAAGNTEVVSGGGGMFERRYSLAPYGILPAGTYRVIVSEDAACDFVVE